MKRCIRMTAATAAFLLLAICTALAAPQPEQTPSMRAAQTALADAMKTLDVSPDTPGFMVLTNAGYGQAARASTEQFLDVAMQTTGRTPGTRTLLLVNTPGSEPLWFALFRADDGRAVFIKLGKDGFASQQLQLAPEQIFKPEVWAATAKGLIGGRLFSVASIALSWTAGAPWPMLKGAELHDHFCPGLNAGFIAKAFLEKHLPLGPGDAYVFVGAPPICAMDALQSAFGATMGKNGAFAMRVPRAAKAHAVDGVAPTLIAMRVNQEKDACDGVFIGFDWAKSEAFTGVSEAERTPPGGKKNPLFFISRVRMSWKLAQMPMEDKLACIKDLGRFSGPASLAWKVADGGADPYAAALSR
ncbi:MAG: FmdE family protein [Pseudodesulfovibrio sp.]